jgi:murein DD-endopeptidase MepM/ murein hydrolase activator NlpD
MKSLLLFLAGVLVGANVVYFLVRAPQSAGPAPVREPAIAATPPIPRTTSRPAAPTTPVAKPAIDPSAPAPATPAVPAAPAPAATTAHLKGLLLPVQGIRPDQLRDTFVDSRGGGTRTHEALDIMAARGTPVLATADGTIEKLFDSVQGGHTIYEFNRDRTFAYYYAHLDAYAPGLAEGQPVRRGDVIATVGSTGNASEDAPHLHFAIFKLGPEKKWWEGTAIDPFPLLANTP